MMIPSGPGSGKSAMPLSRMHCEKASRSGSPAAGCEPPVAESRGAESAGSLVGGAPAIVDPLGVTVAVDVGSDAAD